MVKEWLLSGMLSGVEGAEENANVIIQELSNLSLNKSHARHLSPEKCNSIGLKISNLEYDPKVQDAVLSIHHTCIHTLTSTNAFKIIENHYGKAFIQSEQQVMLQRA